MAREISKKFETFYFGTVTTVIQAIAGADSQRKGEFVIVVSGADDRQIDHQRTDEIMALLVAEMPLKRASKVASKILGQNSNELYAIGLKLKNRS